MGGGGPGWCVCRRVWGGVLFKCVVFCVEISKKHH